MKTLFLPILLLLLLAQIPTVTAQVDYNLLSNWDYRRPNKTHEKINKIMATSNGYLIAIGETVGSSMKDVDGLFILIDAEEGQEKLRKSFGGGGDQSFSSAVQNHDGTITLVGYQQERKNTEKQGWVMRLDQQGNVLYEEKIAATAGKDGEITDVAINTDGQVLAVGTQSDKKTASLWLLGIEAERVTPLNSPKEVLGWVGGICATEDGNFVMVGSTDRSNGQHPEDAWLLKVSAAGTPAWNAAKYLGGRGLQEGQAVTATIDGGFIMAGVTNEGGAGLTDHWLVKFSRAGEVEWRKTYGTGAPEAAQAVIELSTGGYALLGQTGKFSARTMQEVILTDEKGNEVDSDTYPIVQGDGNEIASSLVELYTGDLAIASNSINEKSELSVPYIGAYTYRAITRRPNTVVIQDEFSSGKEEEGSAFALASAGFTDANSNLYLEENERGYIRIQVKNKSDQNIDNVTGSVALENAAANLDYWNDIKLGTMRAGQTKQLIVPVHAKESLSEGTYNFYIKVQGKGSQPSGTYESIKSNQPDPPKLVVNSANFVPNAKPSPGQMIMLEVELINTGGQASAATTVDFVIPAGVNSNGSERLPLPSLRPREKQSVVFRFSYNEGYSGSSIPITLEADIPNVAPLRNTFHLKLDDKVPTSPVVTTTTGPSELMIWASPDPADFQSRSLEVNQKEIDIKVIALSQKPLEKEKFTYLINGKRAKGQKMDEAKLGPPDNSSGNNQQTYSNKVRLSPGENTIQVVYQKADGTELMSPFMTVEYVPAEQPNLYVLSIGVEHSDLKYTTKDAKDIADAFWKLHDDKGRGFKKVEVLALTQKEETSTMSIKKSFEKLSRMSIKDNDLVVVFISSHGKVNQQGNFIFMPSDYESLYESSTSIDFKHDILNSLRRINGKILVLIDACHSGSAFNGGRSFSDASTSKLMNDLIQSSSGLEIIASCGDNEYSYEDESWQNGAFTEAILEAFSNKPVSIGGNTVMADKYNELGIRKQGSDGVITIEELRDFVRQRVPHLVKSKKNKDQTPSHKSTERLPRGMGIYLVN